MPIVYSPDIVRFVTSVYPTILHNSDITENFFVAVQNTPSHLATYKKLYGIHSQLNAKIGAIIKNHYTLTNIRRKKATRTTLIKTYMEH